jgi:hypothetical protein
VEGSGALDREQVTKIDRSLEVNRTRVRAKIRVTPPRMHRCLDIQKASYAGLLLRRADRI